MSPRAACRLEALGFDQVYDYVGGIADWTAAGLPTDGVGQRGQRVGDAIRPGVPTCRPDDLVGDVRSRVLDHGWDVCVVVDCDGMAIGRIRGEDLHSGASRSVAEAMQPGPSTVRPDELLGPLLERMRARNTRHVLVTTPQGVLLGILVRDDAERVVAGDPPEKIWQDCDCCPGRWSPTG